MFPIDKPEGVETLWPSDRLDDLLPQVDFLILSLPLYAKTKNYIDSAAFAKMKPQAHCW